MALHYHTNIQEHLPLTTDDILAQIKKAPQIESALLGHDEAIAIPMDGTPPLSPLLYDETGQSWQRLRLIVVPPTDKPYGIIEAYDSAQHRFILSEMGTEDRPARVVDVLDPAKDKVTKQSTWNSTIKIGADGSMIAIKHTGRGTTEVLGTADSQLQNQDDFIDSAVWAPSFSEVVNTRLPR